MKDKLGDFGGGFATEEETAQAIKKVYLESGYVIDPHTAVAAFVYDKYFKSDEEKAVIISTASPYKFLRSVIAAISENMPERDDFALIDRLHEISGIVIPPAIEEIKTAPVRHETVCEVEEMTQIIYKFLGLI
jgi:threonine synthase